MPKTTAFAPNPEIISENKLDWQAQKELQAKQRKRENDLKKCEEEIAALEERDAFLDAEMILPENATNVARLQEITKEKEEIASKLEALYEKWEALETS